MFTPDGRRWLFPRGDCVLLPVSNTTAELLAQLHRSTAAGGDRAAHRIKPARIASRRGRESRPVGRLGRFPRADLCSTKRGLTPRGRVKYIPAANRAPLRGRARECQARTAPQDHSATITDDPRGKRTPSQTACLRLPAASARRLRRLTGPLRWPFANRRRALRCRGDRLALSAWPSGQL